MAVYLITGANRGIGLALTRHLLQDGHTVYATYRSPGAVGELRALADARPGLLNAIQMDVDDDASIAAAMKQISAQTNQLDWLINNAGIGSGPEQLGAIDRSHMLRFFNTNSTSPLMVAQAAMPLLRNAEKAWIVNISSILGSMGSAAPGVEWSSFAYRSSKAALNMITRTLATFLENTHVGTVTIHPGWVQTDMGGPQAPLSTTDAARRIIGSLAKLSPTHSGTYFDLDGQPLPW